MDFPNVEVRDSFITSLLSSYTKRDKEEVIEFSEKIDESIRKKDEKEMGKIL
jgi:hypothetical protein